MSKPAVVFVASPAPLGGSNVSLATLLRALGERVHRIVAAPPGAFTRLVRAEGLAEEVIDLPNRGRLAVIGRARQAVWLVGRLSIRRHGIDAVHANATSGLRIAALAALIWRLPVVCWIHDMATTPRRMRWGPLIALLGRRVRWVAVSQAARDVVVGSKLCARELVTIVPNPIDPSTVMSVRDLHGQIPLTVCYLGGPGYRKGFDLLPAVIEQLPKEGHRWLLFTNRRSDSSADVTWARLDAFPAGHVSVKGFQADVRGAYAQCDIVFVPSREESFGRVVAEAMLNGIPVVASDIPPFVEQVGPQEAGLLFPVGDAVAAAAAIYRLLKDERLRRNLGEAGQRRSLGYSPAAIADRMLQLYGVTPSSLGPEEPRPSEGASGTRG